jgi:hypothetical protein
VTSPPITARAQPKPTVRETPRPPESDPNWGTLKGSIVWAGDKLPEAAELKIEKDQQHCLANGKLFSEAWVVDKDSRGVRWVLVWLAPEPGSRARLAVHPDLREIKQKQVEIDQPCCRFVPHLVALREGQILVAKNSAPVVHNIRWVGHPLHNPGGSVIMPAKGEHQIKDLKAQKLPVQLACDIHPWMKANAGVFDHPYFAVTDKDGNFEIKNAPAGPCRLVIWQEAIGYRGGAAGKEGAKVTVKGGAITDLGKFDIQP